MQVHQVMTTSPTFLRSRDRLNKAVKLLIDLNINGCPVLSGKRVVGMITQTDIINAIDPHARIIKDIDLLSLVEATLKDPRFENMKKSISKTMKMPVGKFMNRKIIAVDHEEDIYNAARLINENDISMLPVVKNQKLVGILTRTDIVKVLEKLC